MKIRIKFFLVLFCLLGLALQENASAAEWKSMPLSTKKVVNGKEVITTAGEGFQYVMALTYAPSNPNIAYFSTDTTSVWKSENGGKNWFPVFNNFKAQGACSVVVDPVNADIVYAAGYLGYLGRKESEPYKNQIMGIIRSTDGGKNWSMVRPTPFYRRPGRGTLFAFDSRTSKGTVTSTVYAAGSDEGLLKSLDAGNTWQKVNISNLKLGEIYDLKELYDASGKGSGALIIASANGLFKVTGNTALKLGQKTLPEAPLTVAVTPANSQIMLAALGSHGLYRSTDQGNTFQKASWGLTERILNQVKKSLWTDVAISPVDANIAYSRGQYFPFGPLYSSDGGKTWRLPDSTNQDGAIDKEGFWFSSPTATHPKLAKTALHVTNGRAKIIRTNDGGKNWNYSGWGFTGGLMDDMVFTGKGAFYITLTDHGIRRSTDNGSSFTELNAGRIFDAQTGASLAVQKDVILFSLGGWTKRGAALSKNAGKSWSSIESIETSRGIAFIHPQNPNLMFIGNGISTDGGKKWAKIGTTATGTLTIHAAISLPQNKFRLLALGNLNKGTQLYESHNLGKSWEKLGKPFTLTAQQIRQMANVANLQMLAASPNGVRSLDLSVKNAEWKTLGDMPADEFGLRHVSCIAVNPNNPKEIWAGRRSPGYGKGPGIYKSLNGGKTWQKVPTPGAPLLSIWSIQISPYNNTVYAGTWYGTWYLER